MSVVYQGRSVIELNLLFVRARPDWRRRRCLVYSVRNGNQLFARSASVYRHIRLRNITAAAMILNAAITATVTPNTTCSRFARRLFAGVKFLLISNEFIFRVDICIESSSHASLKSPRWILYVSLPSIRSRTNAPCVSPIVQMWIIGQIVGLLESVNWPANPNAD